MKRYGLGPLAITVILLFSWAVLTACGRQDAQTEETQTTSSASEDVYTMNAMFIQADQVFEGQSLFVDTENDMPFCAVFPEGEVYDAEGGALAEEDIQPGNVFRLYGDGIMLESYPGQYPGIVKAERLSEGKPEDVQAYQELLSSIIVEADPSVPASMDIQYSTELAAVSMVSYQGGYTWNYTNENGEDVSIIACGSHILEAQDLPTITDPSVTEATLRFSSDPSRVDVVCWTLSQKDGYTSENVPESEAAVCEKNAEGDLIVSGLKPGRIYLVTAEWDNGSQAEYGFATAME